MPPNAEMVKWWGKLAHEQGRVTRHLSPNEIHPARTLIATLPQKTWRKIKENGPVLIPAALLLVGTVGWGKAANEKEHRSHWS
ncbi:hypothetical protein BBJ28_00025924 [Nothophytophthora sp. Chile5]|nr:hypothetical protein BBJ28_00025924 [Nothophytophthora sp. Chile5]